MRRTSLAALAFVAAVGACAAAQSAPDPIDSLLRAAMGAPSSVSYVGTIEEIRIGSHDSEAMVYRVEHRAPDLTRRFYSAPAALSGDSMVSKGALLYSIDPRHRRIVERRDDAGDATAFAADYALLRSNYRVVRTGSEMFAARSAIDLAFINRYTGRTTMRVCLDATRKIVLEKREFAIDGGLVSEARFEDISYVHAPPPGDFDLPTRYTLIAQASVAGAFETPDDAVRDAGFAGRTPRALPQGFAPVDGDLVDLHGVRTVHLLYSDGLRTVSLFENAQASELDGASLRLEAVRIGAYSAQYGEDGPDALLAWSDGRLHYTLVGEVGQVDLPRLAAAISR